MKQNILVALIIFFTMLFLASSVNAGYRKDPWGSSTWTGPGRPPHWSSEPSPRKIKPSESIRRISPDGHDDYDRGVQRRGRHNHKGGYWRDKHHRWHYHKNRRTGYVYYSEPMVERIVVEREKRVRIYQQVPARTTKQKCGGATVTSKDPETGQIIIEYVTGAKDCP